MDRAFLSKQRDLTNYTDTLYLWGYKMGDRESSYFDIILPMIGFPALSEGHLGLTENEKVLERELTPEIANEIPYKPYVQEPSSDDEELSEESLRKKTLALRKTIGDFKVALGHTYAAYVNMAHKALVMKAKCNKSRAINDQFAHAIENERKYLEYKRGFNK